jgi:hypothetical protein
METTADSARASRTARRLHQARIRFWRDFVVSSYFVGVFGAVLFIGAVLMVGNFREPDRLEKSVAHGQTAQITRPLLDGTFCRHIVFDNTTAQSIEDKVERCEQPDSKPRAKRKTAFSWGGR